MKKFIFLSPLLAFIAINHSAHACSPNLPNYGNCVRLQQEAQRHAEIYHHHHNQYYGQNGQSPNYDRPVDLTTPAHLKDRSETAVAFSPSTGAVGVMSFAYHQSQTHYHFVFSQSLFAHASCLSKALNQELGSVNLKEAERFVKKYGKKSDCQVIKNTYYLNENLIAILKGKLPNGQYQLFMATRPSNLNGFSQEQPEFQSLVQQCQKAATNCEIVGQFGQITELY